jgi:class 3 adenylate cyclase
MSEMVRWLQGLGLEKYCDAFASQDIDLEVAPDLTEQDLEKLGFSLGHRRKFIAAAAKLRQAAAASPAAATVARQQVERRQVTVVFTDLVGSTALAGELDPEDLNRLLEQYRAACASVITRYAGHVAQYLGDGVLAYFGYPRALEHAAERAVRAGLEVVREIGRLQRPGGQALQARVGIVTGLVAAGEMTVSGGTREQTVVGETPNLAARLQGLADPATVLVGPATHWLTKDLYDYADAGKHLIKGVAQPVQVWKVLGERAAESRFAATRSALAGPMVARERESAFLLDAWQRAARGNGHIVLVSGEPGMGKSRLVEALVEQLRGESLRLLRCQCSPYYSNSALFPFKQLLRRTAGIAPDAPAEENLRRVEAMLARFNRWSRPALLLLADLLEVPAADSLSAMEMTPAQRKAETLAILEDFLLAPMEGEPVLLLLEDAHWSDPTTQSLVERLLQRIETQRVLALITQRPEFKTTWASHPQATAIHCKPLGREQCAALIRQVARQADMDDSLIQQIAARSDGVPLYAEELTKSVLEQQAAGTATVPTTLQDSLMARLDRLGRAKDVAQTAAVIGRQFSLPLLAAIADADDPQLREGLERLQDSGLIFEFRGANEPGFSFNHSLVQEAAYESVSTNRRQALHRRIAAHLEVQSSATGEIENALIAHHFSRAGDAENACRYWLLAADKSGQRLAFAEAIANLNAALAEAERIPDAALRVRQVLEVQLKLGATFAHSIGPQSDEAEAALQRAHAIAGEIDAGPQLFQATWGLYINAARKRNFERARQRGEELTAISRRLADETLEFESLHHRWGYAYFIGQNSAMLEHTLQGVRRYDRTRHHQLSYVYGGHDPGVCAYACRATALGIGDMRNEVKPTSEAAIALAESLEHPLTLAFALNSVSAAAHVAGDPETCRHYAESLIRVATRYDYPIQLQVGLFLQAAARAVQEDPRSTLGQLESTFEPAYAYGFLGVYPGVVMAEAFRKSGRGKEASKVITRMLAGSNTPEIGVFVSELWRLRGELALEESASNKAQAEDWLRTAVRIASGQGAKIYLARAEQSLARLAA